MRKIDKIIINTHMKVIHIFFKDKEYNISYEYSERFKLVMDTIKGTKNEKQKTKRI